ncbi:DUF982 domain-containing protein [Rhizobium oryzicola]|uniref:DUF982 domain-containing protein n=1 Tax=Rhizobium oryzicola TaxID=1232668 RepID=A0ABT8T187_9HYPH|nr:DUF982 domain-containing protein [Rhizobium oryzicola]MDO1584401.1 DUF982 domain-containing protein [Rhizobium oryzicola]
MERHPWRDPVKVGTFAVTGPKEALDFLDHRWPRIKGPRFVQAHHTCLAAHDGRVAPEEARACFEEALHEAQIH